MFPLCSPEIERNTMKNEIVKHRCNVLQLQCLPFVTPVAAKNPRTFYFSNCSTGAEWSLLLLLIAPILEFTRQALVNLEGFSNFPSLSSRLLRFATT